MSGERKRVLVVDDSVFARRIISDIIETSDDLEVAGTAINGIEALEQVEKLKPDVITMDVEMPKLDGIETLKRLMAQRPTPVVMLSSLTVKGAKVSIEALNLGAVDVMAKPHGTHSIGLTASAEEVIAKVLAAANVDPATLRPVIYSRRRPITRAASPVCPNPPVVMIASSTGGPRALRTLIPQLGDVQEAAYVVVQHLPEGFSAAMAEDINNHTDLKVREACDGDVVRPGELILAKAGRHCVFERSGQIRVTVDPPLWGVRPAADVTMTSAVPIFGSRLIGVVLTGMGKDGANGMRLIRESGGTTIAEHESTCVVYGMPRTAIELGVVDIVAPLHHIAEAIAASVSQTAQRAALKR